VKLRTTAAALIIAVLAGAGGTLAVQALFFSEDESIPEAQRLAESWLEGVNLNELAEQGLYLSQPPAHYVPRISVGAAKRAAGSRYTDVSARQILLAHLQTEGMGGFDGQVFVVNFDPADPDLDAFCPSAPPIYALAFVDSDTDDLLGVLGADSPSPGCGGPVPRDVVTPAP